MHKAAIAACNNAVNMQLHLDIKYDILLSAFNLNNRHIMSYIIGFVSQKGGVGKSTLARLVAREYAVNQWNVKIADLDPGQGTSYKWQDRRIKANIG